MHENIYISTTYIIMRPSCVCVWGGPVMCGSRGGVWGSGKSQVIWVSIEIST